LQRRVEAISRKLAELIAPWAGIEAVILGEAAEVKTFDPYFTIPFDVFYSSILPEGEERKRLLRSPPAFDTMPAFTEDRFLVDELPVRIRYGDTHSFDRQMDRVQSRQWVFHDAGTHLFYRVLNGQVLFQSSDWLERVRQRLRDLPEHFWKSILDSARLTTAYYLNDVRAAVTHNDGLFFILSLGNFLRGVCSFLFAVNRSFEPSPRRIGEKVKELPRLPDGFGGRFDSLLREDPELPPERKRQIAELLAKSLIAMA